MCTTAMQIAKTYGCRIEGVDLNAKALEKVLKCIICKLISFNKCSKS